MIKFVLYSYWGIFEILPILFKKKKNDFAHDIQHQLVTLRTMKWKFNLMQSTVQIDSSIISLLILYILNYRDFIISPVGVVSILE